MKRQLYLPLLLILLVSGVLPLGQPAKVYASPDFEGPNYPSTAVSVADDIYADIDWTTPLNVGADDSNYAEYTGNALDIGVYMYVLKATDFGFNIPTGATIDGIKLEFERVDASDDAGDALVQLVKGDTRQGEDKSTGAAYPATEAITVFGSETDLWGSSWSDTDITASGFGVAVSATCIGARNAQPQIDFLRITVYYTPPPSISNTPSEWNLGVISEGLTYETTGGLTTAYFTVTNNSAYAINITIGGTDMTGGITWTLSDTATQGPDTYGLKAGLEGGSYSVIVPKTGSNTLISGLIASGTQSWGLQLLAPTTFSDGELKSGTVTLTATQA